MKRKRGSKKVHKSGKRKEHVELNDSASAAVSVSAEDNNCLDQNDDSRHDSEMGIEPPDAGANHVSSFEADPANDSSIGKAGHARLKVKLRPSSALESHRKYSDTQTPSDTDKSNQQAAIELNYSAVENEDSTFSDGQTPEKQYNVYNMAPRKTGGIKIKSSSLVLSNEDTHNKNLHRSKSPPMLSGRDLCPSDYEKLSDVMLPKNSRKVDIQRHYRDAHHDEKELGAALMVIKKVMKMDAAEPFNAPVDPIALGIPDYFDIIDTPMDFGTICHDLERKVKYLNSEDVFKDVQLIWDNCYKYNNKGDYIVDLMKRVKKNFMKYWMAAGLYLDKPNDKSSIGDTERTHVEDGIKPSQDKLYSKGKQKYKRRRHGIDLHKSDCLCAVCVVRRRRKEREKNSPEIMRQVKISNTDLPRDFSLEGSCAVNHECSEDGTSSQDHSQYGDANADFEEVENSGKMETPELTEPGDPINQDAADDEMEPFLQSRGSGEAFQHLPIGNGAGQDSLRHSQGRDLDLGFVTENGNKKDVAKFYQQDADQERIPEESAETSQQHTVVKENPPLEENNFIFKICKSLFPSNVKSVWNGPHSLMRRRRVPSAQSTPMHSALASFMES